MATDTAAQFDAPRGGLRRNSAFGVVGFAVPTVVIAIAYPALVQGIGPESFGVFVLATSLVSVAGIADLGIAPATTHFLARDIGSGDASSAGRTVMTSLMFAASAGAIMACSIWLLAPWMATIFTEGTVPKSETVWTFRLSAIQTGLLFVIQVCSASFKGMQRFEWSALLASALSVASFGGAMAAMTLWRQDVVGVMTGFVAGYVAIGGLGLALLAIVLQRTHIPVRGSWASLASFRRLAAFGIVMTGNSVAALLLYQLQRFIVAATMGPQAVTVYQLATVVPGKIQTLVATGTEALFPYVSGRPEHTTLRRIYLRMLFGGAVVAFLLLVPLVIWRDSIFEIWLGGAIGAQVASLIPLFAAAYFCIALSAAPYHLGNGLGKPLLVTGLYLVGGAMNAVLLLILVTVNASLENVAWAFLIANLATVAGYQVLAETKLWNLQVARGHARPTGNEMSRSE